MIDTTKGVSSKTKNTNLIGYRELEKNLPMTSKRNVNFSGGRSSEISIYRLELKKTMKNTKMKDYKSRHYVNLNEAV